MFLTPQLYERLIQSAREHTVTDQFVANWGQEFSTISSGNHANLFFADEICNMGNGEQWLPARPEVPFIHFNHPDVVNKQVRVKGPVSLYRDERVQLRLTDPSQILTVSESIPLPDEE